MNLLKSASSNFNTIIIIITISLRICGIVAFYYRPYQKTKTTPQEQSTSKPPSTVSNAPSTIQAGTQCTPPSKYNYETNLCATCNGTWTSAIDAVTSKPITLCLDSSQKNVQVTFEPSTTPSGDICVDKNDFFVSDYDGYANVCVKCLSGTAFNTNTKKCVKYDTNGNAVNSDDTNMIKTYYSASPSDIIIPTKNTEYKPASKLTEIPSVLNSVMAFGIFNTILFSLLFFNRSKNTLLIVLILCLIELVLNVNLYYICSSDKYNSNLKSDVYSVFYNVAMNVLSLLCTFYLLYTMDGDDSTKIVHHETEENNENTYNNLVHNPDELVNKHVQFFKSKYAAEENLRLAKEHKEDLDVLHKQYMENIKEHAKQKFENENDSRRKPQTNPRTDRPQSNPRTDQSNPRNRVSPFDKINRDHVMGAAKYVGDAVFQNML